MGSGVACSGLASLRSGRLRETVLVTDFRSRLWTPGWPLDVSAVIGGLRRGRGDPTFRQDPDGTIWRGIRTPAGAATLCLRRAAGPGLGVSEAGVAEVGVAEVGVAEVGVAEAGVAEVGVAEVGVAEAGVAEAGVAEAGVAAVEATAWGAGAEWVLESVPAMLGDLDDVTGFVAHHKAVAEAARRFSGWRVPRTGLVLEALIPSIIDQKVSGQESSGSFRTLIQRYGERAPGEGGARGLWVAPSAGAWAQIPSWEWLRAGVDGARSAAAVRAAAAAGRLEQCVGLTRDEADRRLRAIPGVGVWTAAEVAHTALGDPDAVSFGDYHVAKDIGWALTGAEVDDDGLAELLEPYAGHRYRVQALLKLAGVTRPRRGPRMPARTHLPHRFR